MKQLYSFVFLTLCAQNLCAQDFFKVLNITGTDNKVLGVDIESYSGIEITFGGDEIVISVNDQRTSVNIADGLTLYYRENPEKIQSTIDDRGYATFTPSMDVMQDNNVEVYKVSEMNETSVTIEKTTEIIPAGEGVLLKAYPATYNFSQVLFPNYISEPYKDNLLVGTIISKQVLPNSVYTLTSSENGNPGFGLNAGITIDASTAYIEAPTASFSSPFLNLYDPLNPTGMGGGINR